jgi:signal transduction histidine kinase
MTEERALLTNRLTAIMGFTDLLLEGAYGPLGDKQREVLKIIARSGREVAELVHEGAPQLLPD